MARYRQKDETDLAWNDLRRRATALVDLEIKKHRERILNEVLSNLWQEYAKSLETGQKVELSMKHEATFVRDLLGDVKVSS